MGPDTPALGERSNAPLVTQTLIAASMTLFGEDYAAAVPQAGKPIADVLFRLEQRSPQTVMPR